MPRRLIEQYQPGDRVEICLQQGQQEQWQRGRVVGHDFPGVWVQTEDGSRWYVTNGRRIRPAAAGSSAR